MFACVPHAKIIWYSLYRERYRSDRENACWPANEWMRYRFNCVDSPLNIRRYLLLAIFCLHLMVLWTFYLFHFIWIISSIQHRSMLVTWMLLWRWLFTLLLLFSSSFCVWLCFFVCFVCYLLSLRFLLFTSIAQYADCIYIKFRIWWITLFNWIQFSMEMKE